MRCLVSGRACASLVSVTGTAPPAFLSGPGILARPGIPLRANQNLLDDRLVHHLWYEHTAILTGRQVGGQDAERHVAGVAARSDSGGPGEIGDGPGTARGGSAAWRRRKPLRHLTREPTVPVCGGRYSSSSRGCCSRSCWPCWTSWSSPPRCPGSSVTSAGSRTCPGW